MPRLGKTMEDEPRPLSKLLPRDRVYNLRVPELRFILATQGVTLSWRGKLVVTGDDEGKWDLLIDIYREDIERHMRPEDGFAPMEFTQVVSPEIQERARILQEKGLSPAESELQAIRDARMDRLKLRAKRKKAAPFKAEHDIDSVNLEESSRVLSLFDNS